MKRFMEENRITHNLMAFSGFKGLLIFSMLVEKPCTYKDIIDAIKNNKYLNEDITNDTVRIYINSLRKIGCDIRSEKVGRFVKYYLVNTPFELKITEEQIEALIKVYKAISKSIDLSDFLILKGFFDKIFQFITNDELKNIFYSISPLSNLDEKLVNDLWNYAKNNTAITILYNSKASGKDKLIDILVNKMYISNNKLYISGINSQYKNYSSFLVSKIKKIESINISCDKLKVPLLVVQYKILKDNLDFEPLDYEKIISETENKLVIEAVTENKFELMQRILFFASKCKVLAPDSFRKDIISCLKRMKEGYIEG